MQAQDDDNDDEIMQVHIIFPGANGLSYVKLMLCKKFPMFLICFSSSSINYASANVERSLEGSAYRLMSDVV